MLQKKTNLLLYNLDDSQLSHCLVDQLNKKNDDVNVFLIDMNHIAYDVNFPVWPAHWVERDRESPIVIFDARLATFLPSHKNIWHYCVDGDLISKIGNVIFRSHLDQKLWKSTVSGRVVEDFNLDKIKEIIHAEN